MRTRFHYEIEASGSCGRCKAMIPFGPLRTFRHDRWNVATRCPSCGELELTKLPIAEGMLSGWARVDSLVERARTDDEVEHFEHAVRLTESFPHHRKYCGRVGGPERCVHCDAPLPVPPELAYGSSAAVLCTACGALTHLVPPPRWLVEQSPTWTHLLLPAAPPRVCCAACGATVVVGPHVPPQIRCDACGEAIAIPDTPQADPELDRPRVRARLALTSAAVAARGPHAATPVVVALLTLLLAVGCIWGAIAAREVAINGAIIGCLTPVVVLLGALGFALTLRARRRRQALLAELQRHEASAPRPAAAAEEGPYR